MTPTQPPALDEVRRKDDGTLDEVVGTGDYHLEQMHSGHWSLRLGRHLIGLHSTRAVKATIIENDLPPAATEQPPAHDDLRARLDSLERDMRAAVGVTCSDAIERTLWTFADRVAAITALSALPEAGEAVLPDGGPPCNQHPDAPHGFSRNASHSEDRYVCDCEGWSPEPAADLLVRDVCELDPADPESPDTVTVHVAMLQLIANRYCTIPPAAVSQPAAMVEGLRDWIPVAEKMPKGTHPVLVYFETVYGKGRIVRARHVGKFEVEDEGGENEDFAEYSEETDTYYWPPGWYECNDAKGEDWMMSDTPTYWQSLPPPPSLLSAGAVQGGAK